MMLSEPFLKSRSAKLLNIPLGRYSIEQYSKWDEFLLGDRI
ncbi:MAG: hypothetical protein AAFQ57_08240 [Cyanobacteria bacterium J06626_14]